MPINVQNTGLSSILNLTKYDTNSVKVKAVRMDTFMQEHDISNIDFLKLDVEGCNFEVLEGFGDRLSDIKCIHLEAEHALYIDYKEKNYLYTDIERLLKKNGFELVFFQRYTLQSDSFWVQKEPKQKIEEIIAAIDLVLGRRLRNKNNYYPAFNLDDIHEVCNAIINSKTVFYLY